MNILILSLSGIGNTLLFTPTLKSLWERIPHAKITLLVLKKVFGELIAGSPYIYEILAIEDNKNAIQKIRFLLGLRKRKFDVSITVFPSNKIEFNLLAFLIGAKIRITHAYSFGGLRTLAFLQNRRVLVLEGKHDVEQNLELLRPLGMNPDQLDKELQLSIGSSDEEYAGEFLSKNDLRDEDIIIGIHPGSGEGGQEAKRWNKEKFARLGDMLSERWKAKILIFGGSNEVKLKDSIFGLMRNRPILVDGTLMQTAAIIRSCHLFISNDSSLMHVAATVNVPTIAIFGPTNPQRTAPWGEKHVVVSKNLSCSPCLAYPFGTTEATIRCSKRDCLGKIDVQDIMEIARSLSFISSSK